MDTIVDGQWITLKMLAIGESWIAFVASSNSWFSAGTLVEHGGGVPCNSWDQILQLIYQLLSLQMDG